MLRIDWDIRIEGEKRMRLVMMERVIVEHSAVNLVDTATVELPQFRLNIPTGLRQRIRRGDKIDIALGYNGKLNHEFTGYITEVYENNGRLKILAEDAIFLFRKPIPDKQIKNASLKQVAGYVLKHIDPQYRLETEYNMVWNNFVIRAATGFDVLKKIQEQTRAHIHFDTSGKVLHIHPPYLERGKEVKYTFDRNIEQSSLEYKSNKDRKIEVVVEGTDTAGKVIRVKSGTTGGDQIHIKAGMLYRTSMQTLADNILKSHQSDRYEGSFTGWLIPVVEPGDTVTLDDPDYPERKGKYYVESVKTEVSDAGGKRTVQLGIKL